MLIPCCAAYVLNSRWNSTGTLKFSGVTRFDPELSAPAANFRSDSAGALRCEGSGRGDFAILHPVQTHPLPRNSLPGRGEPSSQSFPRLTRITKESNMEIVTEPEKATWRVGGSSGL